jgi:hypothetical protein
MDKFEQQIVNAKKPYEPSTNFVEETMEQLKNEKPRRRWNIKVWAPALVGTVAVVAIAFIAWPKPANTTDSTNTSDQAQTSQGTQSKSAAATGSDDASLNNDLNSIQGSINQAATDQNGAENAVNDNQQQVTVPTE